MPRSKEERIAAQEANKAAHAERVAARKAERAAKKAAK
jgi:hypothetical protein